MRESKSWFEQYNSTVEEIVKREPDPYIAKAKKHLESLAVRKRWRPVVEWFAKKKPLN